MADLFVTSVYNRPTGELVAVLEGGLPYQVLPDDFSDSARAARELVREIEESGGTVEVIDDSAPPPEPPPGYDPMPPAPPEQTPLAPAQALVTWAELEAVAEASG